MRETSELEFEIPAVELLAGGHGWSFEGAAIRSVGRADGFTVLQIEAAGAVVDVVVQHHSSLLQRLCRVLREGDVADFEGVFPALDADDHRLQVTVISFETQEVEPPDDDLGDGGDDEDPPVGDDGRSGSDSDGHSADGR